MSKICKNCGAELPDGAHFCPYCTGDQSERKTMKAPLLWRKKLKYILITGCIIIMAGLAVLYSRRPRTIEGGAYVTYEDREGSYEIFVGFHPDHIRNLQPVPEKTVHLSPDEMSLDSSMLGIYQDGEIVDQEAFFEKVESCSMEALDNENGDLVYDEPVYSEDFSPAARVCDISYTGNSGTHELVWMLNMKNGDTICLRQIYAVVPLEHQVYSSEDTPMETLEELGALLKRIDEEVPAETIVDIYLPPVTYDGGLDILSRGVNLYGSTGETGRTTFTNTVNVYSDNPSNVILYNLDFEGQGGTGLSATASVQMEDCRFTGWDIGAVPQDGGMIGVYGCTFSGNRIGFKYNSASFHSFNEEFSDCIFEGNDIGVQFARMNGNISIDFAGSTFSNNGTDIDNPIDYPVNTERAVFE